MNICTIPSPLGTITMAGDGGALTGLWVEGQRHFACPPAPEGELPVFDQARQWLTAYFQGQDPGPTPALAPNGTPFQMEVWEILRTIPYGEVTTYGEIAKIIANRRGQDTMSAQAVGQAVGRNPISILIPCHRVVGANGKQTGYAGGMDRKRFLLNLESIKKEPQGSLLVKQ